MKNARCWSTWLNINRKNINLTILKQNIEDIYTTIYSLDPEKDRHKYLCLSCIFGAFLGDSIGSCCEFSTPNPKNHTAIFQYENGIFGPGEVTDDSEMAMSAAFAYIDYLNNKSLNIQNLIYYYYGIWRYSGPKDIGRATTAALRFWNGQLMSETKFNNQIVRIANWDSLANGFLMRISTFITYYYYTHLDIIYETINNYFNQTEELDDLPDSIINLYHDIYIESYKNVEITHPNYENGISSAVFTLMTFVGMIFKDAKKVFSIFEKISKSKKFIECHIDNNVKSSAKFVQQKYVQMISDIINGNQIYVYSQMGYYIHGFKLCIYFLHKYPDMAENKNIDLYYDIMCETCDFGGDTDTNCAIVGAMIGPIIGYKNFKIELFERFIRFVPYNRCQFTTAFMYIYVKYLEEKLLNNKSKNETKDKTENKNEQKIEEKKQEENKNEKKEEKNKDENNMIVEENKPEIKSEDNKIKAEGENEMKNEEKNNKDKQVEKIEKPKENNSVNEVKTKDTNSEKNEQINPKTNNENMSNKNKELNYTAFRLIYKFLNEKMDI
jgi:ADP-ribosylglycohydrolase